MNFCYIAWLSCLSPAYTLPVGKMLIREDRRISSGMDLYWNESNIIIRMTKYDL